MNNEMFFTHSCSRYALCIYTPMQSSYAAELCLLLHTPAKLIIMKNHNYLLLIFLRTYPPVASQWLPLNPLNDLMIKWTLI